MDASSSAPTPKGASEIDTEQEEESLLGVPGPSSRSDQQKRRSSTRSIKRKKFDDELVESSLNSGGLSILPVRSTRGKTLTTSSSVTGVVMNSAVLPVSNTVTLPSILQETRKANKVLKRPRRPRQSQTNAQKDIGRWKPSDDLALILAIQQTGDLLSAYRGVKFSCFFTLEEITDRWYALLYDRSISRLALSALRNLTPQTVTQIQASALFSKAEEQTLATVSSNSQPTLAHFEKLLQDNPSVFRTARTAQALQYHWQLMKQYHLLPDQSVQPLPKSDHVVTFADADELLRDSEVNNMESDEILQAEISQSDRLAKAEIRQLENEVTRWQVLVEAVTGISPPDFDNQTLAVLRGRLVRYLMRSKEVTFGRNSVGGAVDIDLSLEGPAWKISRRQGVIKLRTSGEFLISNEGRRPFFVDGRPVLPATRAKLTNNCVLEIAGLKFVFLINQDLINAIRTEAARLHTPA